MCGTLAAGFDRPVVDLGRWLPPVAQHGEIDEALEGRARLAPRLRRAVERAVGVILAADHRDHLSVRTHRDERDLRLAERRARDGAEGARLEPRTARRTDRLAPQAPVAPLPSLAPRPAGVTLSRRTLPQLAPRESRGTSPPRPPQHRPPPRTTAS